MAYQFFAKAHQSKAPTSPPTIPPPSASSNKKAQKPPRHPPSFILPQSTTSPNLANKLKPPTSHDTSYQPPAYPHPIAPGYKTPHPSVTIDPVNTAHIPSLTRITSMLLPTRYPNSFYTATITDPVIASVSRVAIYHNHPTAAMTNFTPVPESNAGADKLIGGIRCRLERLPPTTAELLQTQSAQEPTNLYIQTLNLLSPYRGYGIAASLLNSLLFSVPPSADSGARNTYQVSDLVKHYNVRTVTAHVHEANDEGLKWYIARGFQVEGEVVANYYRRLQPSGARIVKLVLQRSDDADESTKSDDESEPKPSEIETTKKNTEDDDDWERVEVEDGEDNDDHGVRPLADSKILEPNESTSRKRKADDEPPQP
ncbi:hypothetical protein BDV25DRAFT_160668 [Aspergillus avenaceus]|uniref:N-acetyltransferase domain-containing protein n=1 Tax=Aspergillus avenaceus TaxID=36643 RepID=A0A5N6TMH3_ASPAV|nr:hypothetical protein BDV25DRAFT_160668 [Aspergillus avenaceus]